MIHYRFLPARNETLSDARIDQIIRLYREAGWWESPKKDADTISQPDRKHVRRMITGSHCFLVAELEKAVIGMGRVISDGESDAYIQDITVTATHRKKNIGSQIVIRLVRRIESDGLKWIGLIAERNTHTFYEKIGFKPMTNSAPMLKTIP